VTSPAVLDVMLDTYRRWPVELVSGAGCRVTDSGGNEYIDLVAGIATASLGHAHPVLTDAIAEQAGKLTHVSNLYETGPQKELAERLAALCDGKRAFFCNSGAEAIECALKLVRKHHRDRTGGPGTIVCATGGFHGRTMGALAATGQPAKQAPFEPLPRGFTHVPYGDAAALEAAMSGDVAAVLLEPIQGEAGVIVPPDGYLAAVRALCDERGALLVLDEIQTGLGRTGSFLAAQQQGVVADVVCLAKGLAGGLPIGACLAAPEVAGALGPGDHGSTFGGNPVVCAAAVAVLTVIEDEGLVERSVGTGKLLADGLASIFEGCEVRGWGLLLAVDLGSDTARAFCEGALARGVLVNDCTPSVLRFCPPLIIADEDIEAALDVLAEVWAELS
jgi:acetylornithine/N-succinyldiaminopimelate aminotransferase